MQMEDLEITFIDRLLPGREVEAKELFIMFLWIDQSQTYYFLGNVSTSVHSKGQFFEPCIRPKMEINIITSS